MPRVTELDEADNGAILAGMVPQVVQVHRTSRDEQAEAPECRFQLERMQAIQGIGFKCCGLHFQVTADTTEHRHAAIMCGFLLHDWELQYRHATPHTRVQAPRRSPTGHSYFPFFKCPSDVAPSHFSIFIAIRTPKIDPETVPIV